MKNVDYNTVAQLVLESYSDIAKQRISSNSGQFGIVMCNNLVEKFDMAEANAEKLKPQFEEMYNDIAASKTKIIKIEFLDALIDFVCNALGLTTPGQKVAIEEKSHAVKTLLDNISEPTQNPQR